jgi:hypothetical protein
MQYDRTRIQIYGDERPPDQTLTSLDLLPGKVIKLSNFYCVAHSLRLQFISKQK